MEGGKKFKVPAVIGSLPDEEVPVATRVPETKGLEERKLEPSTAFAGEKVIRAAGGKIWEDSSLSEWDPLHYRLFVGDLAPDVDTALLETAFSKYSSLSKAKVIRDNRTGRPKGYGFVAFKDRDDYARAMREMHGKYVGSRPVKLKKSSWQDRTVDGEEGVSDLRSLGYKVTKPRHR